MEHLSFFLEAMRDRKVASVVPTAPASVRRICRRIDKDRPVTLVEYGPGTGAFTRPLLKHLHPESTVIAVELNTSFAAKLRRFSWNRPADEPKLIVQRDDAGNVQDILREHGFDKADYVLSGIPFSLIEKDTRTRIIDQTYRALTPNGCFLVYQFSFHVRKLLKERFEAVRSRRVLLNIPPLCVMEARKTDLKRHV